MIRKSIILVLLLLIPGWTAARVNQVDLGLSFADGKLQSFYLAVGDYYGVPQRDMMLVRERYRLRDEELPVAFFLAARARINASVVLDLRVGGMSWLDIAFRYGLTPEIFYVPVTVERIGPPYGNAYGYFKKYRANREWKRVVLSDQEVVDLVNLRFVSEYHRIPPETVMELRGRGQNFITIHEQGGKAKGKLRKDKGTQTVKRKGRRK